MSIVFHYYPVKVSLKWQLNLNKLRERERERENELRERDRKGAGWIETVGRRERGRYRIRLSYLNNIMKRFKLLFF
jgi:hypothetical protein